MSLQPPRTYTVEEANQALDKARPLVEKIVDCLWGANIASRYIQWRERSPGA